MRTYTRKHDRLHKSHTLHPLNESTAEGGNPTFDKRCSLLKYNKFVLRTFVQFQRRTQMRTTSIHSCHRKNGIRVDDSDPSKFVVEVVEEEADCKLTNLS